MRKPPSKDEEFYHRWGLDHPFCGCCGRQDGLSTHHIVKQGRAHEACNLLRLCQHPCHDLAEGLDVPYVGSSEDRLLPKLTIGVCLTLKWINDPAEYDAARLQELRGCRLPDPEPIPAAFATRLRWYRPDLAVRMLEAADLSIIPRPPEFIR